MGTIEVKKPVITVGTGQWELSSAVEGAGGATLALGFTVGTTECGSSTLTLSDDGPKSFAVTLPQPAGSPPVVAWAKQLTAEGAVATTRTSEPAVVVADDGTTPVELPDPRDLVWSKPFAWISGLVLVVLLSGLVVGIYEVWDRQLGQSRLPSHTAEIVVALGACIGAAAVLVGAWVVVLEMRGRAPRRPSDPGTARTIRISSTSAAGDVGDVVDALAKFRGPLLLVVVGALLVGAMAFVGRDVARDQLPPATTVAPPATTIPGPPTT